jgi:hypothetical protein
MLIWSPYIWILYAQYWTCLPCPKCCTFKVLCVARGCGAPFSREHSFTSKPVVTLSGHVRGKKDPKSKQFTHPSSSIRALTNTRRSSDGSKAKSSQGNPRPSIVHSFFVIPRHLEGSRVNENPVLASPFLPRPNTPPVISQSPPGPKVSIACVDDHRKSFQAS